MKRLLRYGVFAVALWFAGSRLALAWGPPNHGPAGYLGVDVRDAGGDPSGRSARGAEVVRIDHDGPAAKAGIREHDIVVMVNGQAVDGEESIRRMLHELPPGHSISLVIGRDGQTTTITTQMANREVVEREAWERHMTVPEPVYGFAVPLNSTAMPPETGASGPVRGSRSFLGSSTFAAFPYTGAMLEVIGSQLAGFFGASGGSGLLVHSVDANSPAAIAGLRAGDLVVRANAQSLASTSDWARILRDSRGRPVTMTVLRDKKETALTLLPAGRKHIAFEPDGLSPPTLIWIITL